jgi:hypothetical protein
MDFKIERKNLRQMIIDHLDPLFKENGFLKKRRIYDSCFWACNMGWTKVNCNLGVTKYSDGIISYIGGASIEASEKFYPLFLISEKEIQKGVYPLPIIGGPLHGVDRRITHDCEKFKNMKEFEERLLFFHMALKETVIPELLRYTSEDILYEALLPDLQNTTIKLSVGRERRVSLLTLMKAEREGEGKAIDWAHGEMKRLDEKKEEPLPIPEGFVVAKVIQCPKWREVKKVIEYLNSKN